MRYEIFGVSTLHNPTLSRWGHGQRNSCHLPTEFPEAPYFSNAEKLAASIKVDFAALRAVHGKEITVGEFIAHALPLSSLKHVDSILSTLLGNNFLQELKTITSRWSHEIKEVPVVLILAKPDIIYADVARTFELRHIICHEQASAYQIEADEVSRCFESCVAFLRAADEYLSETLYPGALLTQADMNIAAGQSLEAAKTRLAAFCEAERSRVAPDKLDAFNDAQAKWQVYCDAWAKVEADGFSGSMWATVYKGIETSIIERRIAELSEYRKLNDTL